MSDPKPDSGTRVGHWKKDDCDVYVGRGDYGGHLQSTPRVGQRGWLGNPFTVDAYGREGCIEEFREAFEARLEYDDEFRATIRLLAGKTLGCWCQRLEADSPACHAEVIAEHADRLADELEGAETEPLRPGEYYDQEVDDGE